MEIVEEIKDIDKLFNEKACLETETLEGGLRISFVIVLRLLVLCS